MKHHYNALYSLQLFFEGKLDSKHGYIAVGGLYVTPGYCAIQPPNANRGKNMTLVVFIREGTFRVTLKTSQAQCQVPELVD